jgi:transposase
MRTGYEIVLKLLERHFGKRGANVVVCLILMTFGITHPEIQKRQGTALSTLRRYRNTLDGGSIDALFVVAQRERLRSQLDDYESEILVDFETKPPKTLREAQSRIEALTGLRRSLHRLDVWLKKKGLRSRSVGFLPAKANPEEQKKFVNDTILPLIESAKTGLMELFFVDASHFVMGGFPGRVWSVVRRFVKTGSGRKRYNILGALNFVTKKMETICNDTYITATQVVELLEKLAVLCNKPIHIILDNVAYQKCVFVKETAERLGITLHFLPTYSPNLNLIERVWELVKSEVLNAAYYETFVSFCGNINGCVDMLHTRLADDMSRLIVPKFHFLKDISVVESERLCG